MKQRGGSIVDSNTVFIVVMVIAVFNIVAYLHVRDWSSIAVFLLAGALTISVTTNRTLGLVAAIVTASLFRATNNLNFEGMATKRADKAKNPVKLVPPEKQKMKPKDVKNESVKDNQNEHDFNSLFSAEGMSGQLDQLQNNQKVLTNGIKALQPLMQQASIMLKGLPSGFLDEALKKFTKNNGKMNI
jgi:hypothetical protein